MMRTVLLLPISRLELVLTLLEIAFGCWLYGSGYSGAAGLVVGGALASFLSRRMAPYHMARYAQQLLDEQSSR